MNEPYELNEKDIDSTINFLRTIDPDNATPEMAIEFLEELQAGVHKLAHTSPEQLTELYKELKEKNHPKSN